MAYNPFGQRGIIWSAEPATPWLDPQEQLLNLTLTGAGAVGVGLGLQRMQVGNQGLTALDLVQSTVRNIAMATPFGLGNTLRLPEFMAPYMSSTALGLKQQTSISDVAKTVSIFEIGPEYLRTKETHMALKGVVGEKAFYSAGLDLHEDFKLRYETDSGAGGRGSLYAQQVKWNPETKKYGPAGDWKKLSNAISLFEVTGAQDIIDIAGGSWHHNRTNPALMGVLQSLGVTEALDSAEKDVNKIFSKLDNEGKVIGRSRYGFVPSVSGPVGTWDDIARRFAIPGAYPAFGMQRFNRLLDATAEQFPGLQKVASSLSDVTGVSLKAPAGPAHKMFAHYGVGAAKVGAIYLGVEQLDHWRRQYGLGGEVIVSGAMSAGAMAAYKRVSKGKTIGTPWRVGAAAFFGQLLLPGFDQGLKEGIATIGTKFDIGGAGISEVLGINAYRRTLEGFLPGVTDWTTGAFVGVATLTASYTGIRDKIWSSDRSFLPSSLTRKIGIDSASFSKGGIVRDLPVRLGDQFWDELVSMAEGRNMMLQKEGTSVPWQMSREQISSIIGKSPSEANILDRHRLKREMFKKVSGHVDNTYWFQNELYARKERSIANIRELYLKDNPVNDSLVKRIGDINQKYFGSIVPQEGVKLPMLDRVGRFLEVQGATAYHAFFGASLKGEEFLDTMKTMKAKPFMGRAGTIFASILGAQQILTGGLFGFSDLEGPSSLMDIYSGKKEVAVRRGRWWEGGGTPYHGAEDSYYRPHWYHLMMSRGDERAVWGENEDELSPIEKFFYKNFTYEMEKRTYYDRPYPMTGAAFQDVPIIGNILAATIGKLIKPPRLMHTGEYMRAAPDGSIEFAHQPEFHGPSMELGGKPLGIPRSPFDSSFVLAEAQYKFRELEGLTGWAKNMIQKKITGAETFGTTLPTFAQAGSMDSPIEKFWDLDLGGAAFMSEPLRRILPRPRSEIDEYNPLVNRMPSWIPDRLRYGDPYRSIPMGWARLPGAGYAALHPELKGLDPEAYPLIYRYKILADVAPTSTQLSRTRQQLYTRRAEGITSEAENILIDKIDENLRKVAVKGEFDHVHPNAIQLPGSGTTQAGWSFLQKTIRKTLSPAEYLVPMGFRPAQKLLSDRGMIEQYEYERLYGSPNAFWDKPWRDWFRPSLLSAANAMGWEGKPLWRQEADANNEYFDKLNFLKYMRLAEAAGSKREKNQYLRMAQQTRYGVNPKGDAMSVYMTLPDSEKKFFDAFAFAVGDDRARIKEMIPEDQINLYESIWSRVDQGDQTLRYGGSQSQINEDYLMRRYGELKTNFTDQNLPPEDWIGWNEDVEMDDVKMKFVDESAKDIHEYDMWHSQKRKMVRKPYLNDSTAFMYNGPKPSRSEILREAYWMARGGGPQPLEFYGHTKAGIEGTTSAQIYYNHNMLDKIHSGIDKWGY